MDEYVLLGKVTKPHGIRGEIKVYPYSGDPAGLGLYERIWLSGESGRKISHRIVRSRVQGRFALLTLSDCTTRDQAENLAGQKLWVRRSEMPEVDEDEFYLQDLEGLQVVEYVEDRQDGRVIGRITGILDTGAHDILIVRDGAREYLIPVQRDFIVSIDDDKVEVDLPPGLLDINP
ncbi:ribosome maturation factor RimM [Desulfolithobacter sp.]